MVALGFALLRICQVPIPPSGSLFNLDFQNSTRSRCFDLRDGDLGLLRLSFCSFKGDSEVRNERFLTQGPSISVVGTLPFDSLPIVR